MALLPVHFMFIRDAYGSFMASVDDPSMLLQLADAVAVLREAERDRTADGAALIVESITG